MRRLPTLALALLAAGCGASAQPAAPTAWPAPRPEPEPPKPPFGIDASLAKEFPETARVGRYELRLPDGFGQVESDRLDFGRLLGGVVTTWGGRHSALVGGVLTGQAALHGSNDMPELLRSMVKGFAKVTQHAVKEFTPPANAELLGCKYTRLSYTCEPEGDRTQRGSVYGAFDGEGVVVFIAIAEDDQAAARLDAAVVGLKVAE